MGNWAGARKENSSINPPSINSLFYNTVIEFCINCEVHSTSHAFYIIYDYI